MDTVSTAFKELDNPLVRLWHDKEGIVYKVEIRHKEFMAYCNPDTSELSRLREMERRLEKEIAYATWRGVADNTTHEKISEYIENHLRIVEGSYTHEPEYVEEFEKIWSEKNG